MGTQRKRVGPAAVLLPVLSPRIRSERVRAMLTAVLGSANFATEHAKRKTLQVEDMHLVQSIIGKSGSYAGLLGF